SPRSNAFNTAARNGSGSSATAPQIVWKDEIVTAYVEKAHPVSSKGHVVIVLNLHVPSIYALSSSDLPILLHIQQLAIKLLGSANPPPPPASPNPGVTPNTEATQTFTDSIDATNYHIGFITSPFTDPKIPIRDHIHAHAYVGPMDLAGWWRKVSYSGLAWYAIDDLIAEIREQTSNNRIKSAIPGRGAAPIDSVPDAGAKAGLPNGLEFPVQGVGLGATSGDNEDRPFPPTLQVQSESPTAESSDESRLRPESRSSSFSNSKRSPPSSSTPLRKPTGPRTRDSIALSTVSSTSSSPPPPAVESS
ncbi:hypothetical protein FRC02_009480, partial [Tulasnella sp. 418]